MCAVLAKVAGDAPVPAHAKFAEIRLRPRLRHQPFQQRAQPLLPTPLQAEPRRRSRRVARSLRGTRDSVAVLAETSSNWPDTTLGTPPANRRRSADLDHQRREPDDGTWRSGMGNAYVCGVSGAEQLSGEVCLQARFSRVQTRPRLGTDLFHSFACNFLARSSPKIIFATAC